MKLAACLLVRMNADSLVIVHNAVNRAFPQASFVILDSVDEALNRAPMPGGELLILAGPDDASVAKATKLTDANLLRRWAIVVLGVAQPANGVEIVSQQECNEQVLVRAFQSAVVHHGLLRENERLQNDLRTLAYRISHDLRTPLGGILSTGEVLKELLAELDPSRVPLTKPLFDSADDLGKLVDRVSMLLKASVNPAPKKTLAMGEIVWAVLQRQERQILKTGFVITQPDSWPEVEAVSSWLEAVWGNLLSNALQHGKTTTRIDLGWSQNEGEYGFSVTDDGVGISSEAVGNLFQPFHMLYHTSARKGLGLSIVQRLIELQGGRCVYEPSVNGGACFCFTLPILETQPVSVQTGPLVKGQQPFHLENQL